MTVRRSSRFVLACAVMAAGACSPFQPNLGPTPFRCAQSSTPKCPSGYACVNGLCVLHGQPFADSGKTWDTGLYRPDLGMCPDADLEPNDSTALATILLHQDQTLANLAICPAGDVDYYSIFLKNGQQLTVDVLENPHLGEIDAQISDGKTTLMSASGANADQHMVFTASADDTFYIVVQGATSSVENDYTMQIQLTGLGPDGG